MKDKLRKYSLRSTKQHDPSPADPTGFRTTIKQYVVAFDKSEIHFCFMEIHSMPAKYALHEISGKPSDVKLLFELYPRIAKELESVSKDPEQTLKENGFTSWRE